MAAKNNYITVAYKLYVADEESGVEDVIEEATTEHPFQFISNMGTALDSFEKVIDPLSKGDKFDFTIPAKDAYGEFRDELMIDVPKNVFEINGRFDKENIFEGNVIPLANENGERFNGTVIEIKENSVTIDLNHPRAGQDLHFVGEVVEHREATNDEITGMLNMLSGEGCGCRCGDCGGDCGGGCGGHHHDHDCGCGHCH